MARGDGIHRTSARNMRMTTDQATNAQAHNEREKPSYVNQDIIRDRTPLNVHFKTPTAGYAEMFEQMRSDGVISTRGLKADAEKFGELIFDVNSAYFFNHGGYDFAKQFYMDAYKAAIKIIGGEQYILSAVMHADERNRAMSDALGQDVYHYHLHVFYIPVVEKQILWSKRCKDPALVGTVKETVMQISHSKKWQSRPVLDEFGEPLRTKTGKIVLKKSYSILQDQYHDAMFAAGYTDVERGERSSTEEHLTTVQFKVMKEQETLDTLMAQQQSAEQAVRLAQANREEAEREVEAAKKKMDALVKSDKEVKAFVQSLGSADELLPDTGMLETARSYRASKALPVIKKLVRKLREVYALLVNERQKNTDMLRETAYWKRKAEPNELMQEKVSKLDRLTRTLGADEIDRLLSQRSTHEHSRYKAWETNR